MCRLWQRLFTQKKHFYRLEKHSSCVNNVPAYKEGELGISVIRCSVLTTGDLPQVGPRACVDMCVYASVCAHVCLYMCLCTCVTLEGYWESWEGLEMTPSIRFLRLQVGDVPCSEQGTDRSRGPRNTPTPPLALTVLSALSGGGKPSH